MRPQILHFAVPVIAAASLLVLSGCGSDETASSSSTPATTPTTTSSSSAMADGCQALADLQASLTDLSNVDPLKDGLNALESAVADSKTKLNAAAVAASDALQPSVKKVQTAFKQLETALQGVSTDNLAQSATEIGTALTEVGTAATDLKDTLDQDCPTS